MHKDGRRKTSLCQQPTLRGEQTGVLVCLSGKADKFLGLKLSESSCLRDVKWRFVVVGLWWLLVVLFVGWWCFCRLLLGSGDSTDPTPSMHSNFGLHLCVLEPGKKLALQLSELDDQKPQTFEKV